MNKTKHKVVLEYRTSSSELGDMHFQRVGLQGCINKEGIFAAFEWLKIVEDSV